MKKILYVFLLLSFLGPPAFAQSGATGNLNNDSTDCTKTNACLEVNLTPQGVGGVTFGLTGTFNAVIQFEGSVDQLTVPLASAHWVALSVNPSDGTAAVTSTTQSGSSLKVAFQANPSGFQRVRMRVSTYTSGTIVGTINISSVSAKSTGTSGSGSGTITSCSTAGGIAYENGTANTLTCQAGLQYNNSSRNEVLIGKGVPNIVDSGQAGVSFINPLAASNTFGLLESTSTDGGFALSFAQAGRAAGGMGLQGAGGSIPGAMETGVFGILDPTVSTEFEFIPDSGILIFGPHNANFLNWVPGGTASASVASAGLDDTNSVFSVSATNNTTTQVEEDFDFANGIWKLSTGSGVLALTVDASQKATFVGPVAVTSDGVHNGEVSLICNTTNAALPANTVSLLGCTAASNTAWGITLPTAEPASAGVLHLGAAASHYSAATVSAVSLSADVTGTLPNASVGAAPLPTPGSTCTFTAPRTYCICTTTCTITVPVPAAGYEFCAINSDNVATVITMSAIGSSARYENTARTAYGTAGTGTFVSNGAVGDKACLLGLDSTHYLTVSFTGTWTAN